jgi:hypothetical protein
MIKYELEERRFGALDAAWHLRRAREMLKASGNKQAIKAVRRAIKSTEGVLRHLNLKTCRETLKNE